MSNLRNLILLAVIFALFISAACQRAETNASAAESKRFDFSGKIISVDKSGRKAKIEHDDVKGYMPAMTMDFPLKEEWVIRELEPNDKVAADLVIAKDASYYLENVKIMKAPRDANGGSAPEVGANLIGVEVPDFKLINQDGKSIGLNDFRGKALAITFIFTRCPDAEMCPLMSINFSDMEKQIRQNPDLAAKARLLSVTFDPAYDKPEILRNYAAGYQGKDVKTKFDIWQLATGSEKQVKDLEGFLGANSFKGEDQRIVHNLRTVVIAPDGKIAKIYAGNNWKTAEILRDLQTAASVQAN